MVPITKGTLARMNPSATRIASPTAGRKPKKPTPLTVQPTDHLIDLFGLIPEPFLQPFRFAESSQIVTGSTTQSTAHGGNRMHCQMSSPAAINAAKPLELNGSTVAARKEASKQSPVSIFYQTVEHRD